MILLIHLWGKGSRAKYFPGSHLITLPSFRTPSGMWEVPLAALDRAGIVGKEEDFEDGGL